MSGTSERKRGDRLSPRALSALAAIAFACAAVAAGAAPAAAPAAGGDAQAAAKRGSKLILLPRRGRAYRTGPLYVKVRAGRRARVRVRLNGRVSNGGWSRIRHKRLRKIRLSPNHGLRHGRNVLRVTVRRPAAKRGRSQTVVFRIAGRRPLAAAGRDRRIATGSRVRLDGRESRLHPSVRRRGGGLRHRWVLVRAPRGSRLARRARHSRRSRRARSSRRRAMPLVVHRGPRALLRGVGSPVPRLRPDAPGTYKLELRVKGPAGTEARDETVLRVDPDPLVRIDTISAGVVEVPDPDGKGTRKEKRWGVTIGNQFYPDPGDSKKWLQVVLLREENLELISNKAYDCPQATGAAPQDYARVRPCIEELRKDLKAQPPRTLVVAASQRVAGRISATEEWLRQPPVGAWEALSPATDVPPRHYFTDTDAQMLRGRFSLVGSLGGRGRLIVAHDNNDLDKLGDDGEIKGGLLRDNRNGYSTYRSFEQLPFDTRAPGSDERTNVMVVGGGTYKVELPPDAGGFHVVLVDTLDLGGTSRWFPTGNAAPAERVKLLREMRDMLAAPLSGRTPGIALIASRGDARLKVPDNSSTHELDTAVEELVNLLSEQYGATRNRAYRAFDPYLGDADQRWPTGAHTRAYTLVAASGTRRGEGLEVESARPLGNSPLLGAPVAGSLTRRGFDYGFEIDTSSAGEELDGAGIRLRDTAFSPPGSWPEQKDAGHAAAVRWATEQVNFDTRRAYLWTQPNTFDWTPKVKEIKALSYPKNETRFTEDDLEWAKKELVTEIEWLITTRSYVASLAEPFTDNQLAQWAVFNDVANTIDGAINVPKDDKAMAKLHILFTAVREAAGELEGPPGDAVGVVNAIYEAVLEWAKLDTEGGEVGEPFSLRVGSAGRELAERMTVAQQTLKNQMVKVIAADYRKLRTVGLCAALLKSCPDGPVSEWQVTKGDQEEIAEAVKRGAEAVAYTALFPAKYTAWLPATGRWRSVNWEGHQPAGEAAAWFCPFHDLPASAQFAFPIRRNIGSHSGALDTWQVVAYGERTGSGSLPSPYAMNLPKAEVTDPVFRSASAGGLGFTGEKFFLDAYLHGGGARIPFDWPGGMGSESTAGNGFPLQVSRVQWISKDDPIGVKTASCGY